MNSIWFRELGFFNNPFSIKPAIYSDAVVGYDEVVDEISFGILNKKMMFLAGEYGEGKSTILKRLINDFGGKKKVIYYSCNRIDARLNVKKLLNGRYGFWGRLFDMKPKDMILLLDEAQELGKKDYEKLYSYYQEGYFKSIVFVGKEFDKKEIEDKIKEMSKDVALKKLSDDEAVKIIRRRIGSLPLLTDDDIKNIYALSDKNIRQMLKNCESVCKHAVNYGETKITDEIVKDVLGVEVKEEKKKPVATKKVEKKEKKVVKKKTVKKKLNGNQKSSKKVVKKAEEKRVYKPEEKLNIGASAEDMLNKGTDELFDDEQYY